MAEEKMIDDELPRRLFATDHFPIRQLNIYSKLDLICFVEEKLHGTDELELIKSSQFGKLFKLPANQCATSCKLIQAMMARQLLTNKKYEMWTVFAGTPLRFSILEFEELTGLFCGRFPKSYYSSQKQTINMGEGSTWHKIVGDTEASLSDVADLLSMTGPEMPGWRKLCLALILIIDGVLIANLQKSRPTAKYVDMLSNRDMFFSFPWGRECFKNTIAALTPPTNSWGRCDDDYASFTNLMLQKTLTVKGFPQVLQLLAYRSIPRLLDNLSNKADKKKLCEVKMAYLQKSVTLTKDEIWEVEHEANVAVKPMIDLEGRYQEHWVDEIQDSSVNKLVSLIRQKHSFTNEDWIGGDNSEPKNGPKRRMMKQEKQTTVRSKRKGKQHVLTPVKDRRSIRKISNRKQTKIGQYFAPTNITVEEINVKVESNSSRIEKLEADLRKVKARADKYERLYKQSRIVRFGKLSSQKAIRCRRKKTNWEDGSIGRSNSGLEDMDNEDVQCTPRTTSEHGGTSTGFEDRGTTTPKRVESLTEDSENIPREEKPAIVLSPQKLQYSPTFASVPAAHIKLLSQEIVSSSKVNDKSEDSSHSLVRKARPALLRIEYKIPFGPTCGEVLNSPKQLTDAEGVQNDVEVHTVAKAEPHTDAHASIHLPGSVVVREETKNPESSIMESAKTNEGSVENPDLPIDKCTTETNEGTVGIVASEAENIVRSIDNLCADVVHKNEDSVVNELTEISGGEDNPSKTSETEEVDDANSVNSPAKRKRKRAVNSYDEQICRMLKTNREKRPREATELFPALESDVFDLMLISIESSLKRVHKTSQSPDISNQTLLDIASPQRWIESTHMEVLMYMLGRLHSRVLGVQRATFVSPYFINLVYAKVDEFKRPKDKRRIKWSENIKKFVKNERGEWLADFDTIYIPMSIENKHWVGLAINLQVSSIEVLDPNCDYMTDKKICSHLQHLSVALPHVLKSFCSFQYGVNVRDKPFLIERTRGLYKNERGGDCGPVAVKFMEMHLYGSSHEGMASLDDKTVDRFRKQYAVDVYAGCLMPEYS